MNYLKVPNRIEKRSESGMAPLVQIKAMLIGSSALLYITKNAPSDAIYYTKSCLNGRSGMNDMCLVKRV